MPSTYTTNLGIQKPANGEQAGAWGQTVNTNSDILDRAVNGSLALSLSGTSSTLTTLQGVASNGQYKILSLTGSPSGTHTITIDPATAQTLYLVNNTTAQSVIFTQGSGGNVTIVAGASAIIYSDGAGATAKVTNLTNTLAMSAVKITGGTITGITDLAVADGGTGASDASGARTNLGIGTMGTQAASAVAITGGTITGITDLAIADGGTGSGTASGARTNLGLGTIATQNASAVAITGGTAILTGASSITVSSSSSALTITQTGAGNALVVEDSTNPDSSPFVIDAVGAVGIGVAAPVFKFEVLGSTLATGPTLTSVIARVGDNTNYTQLRLRQSDTESRLESFAEGTGVFSPLTIHTGGLERFRVGTSGQFGINGTNYGTTGQTIVSAGSAAAPAWGILPIAGGGSGSSTGAGAISNFGITASITEINYVGGVTSAIQTQLNTKIPNNADAALTGGYTTTADADGTFSTGTYTPVPSGGNMKTITNGGAFTFAAPTATGDYTLVVRMVNNASAGAVTFSGFNKVGGDTLTTTNTSAFFVFITKCGGSVSAIVQALQ